MALPLAAVDAGVVFVMESHAMFFLWILKTNAAA
jgi:hypothetical protein